MVRRTAELFGFRKFNRLCRHIIKGCSVAKLPAARTPCVARVCRRRNMAAEEPAMQDVDTLWADFARPIVTADDYIASLRGRRMNVFFMGERVEEPVDNPVIFPSINAMAETYRLASERPELGSATSDIAGLRTNRFLHVPTGPQDLVTKHEMQRELGRRTGTCFQRCVGLDAIGACHSVTFDIDAANATGYHERFLAFLKRAQTANVVIGGAMTDPKGDRSLPPHKQADPDLFLRVVKRDETGIYISGA